MTALISPMKKTVVRNLIYDHIVNKLNEQKQIAQSQGLTEDDINLLIDFNIFNNVNRVPDVSQMPCAIIYWDKTEFENSDLYENDGINTLVVDIFACGYANTDDTAEQYASNRYDYLESQIFNILCRESACIYSATNNLVSSFIPLNIDNVYQNEADSSAGAVYMGRFLFRVEIDEPTEYLSARQIKEFYFKTEAQNDIISTFIEFDERQ